MRDVGEGHNLITKDTITALPAACDFQGDSSSADELKEGDGGGFQKSKNKKKQKKKQKGKKGKKSKKSKKKGQKKKKKNKAKKAKGKKD